MSVAIPIAVLCLVVGRAPAVEAPVLFEELERIDSTDRSAVRASTTSR
jgi:hypothetical protein